eukprot:PITA_21176
MAEGRGDLPWARKDILRRFRMQDCRPMSTPVITNWKKINASDDKVVNPTLYRQLISSLMYLVNTRPDICLAFNTLRQFMVEPKRLHWAVTRHILRKQKSVALSSAEVEYIAASIATCEATWLWKLPTSLFKQRMEATSVYCENQSCIKLFENPLFHAKSKHIDIRCHFMRDCVQRGVVQLQYVPTNKQVANILTKALGRAKFVYFKEQMGMVENPFQ